MSDDDGTDRFRSLVYGVAAAATLAFLGWVGMSVNSMTDRLTTIEVTMRENREERLQQVTDLRSRVNRLEDRLEVTRGREGGGQ
ncbi:hypothetical protein [Sphingomonas sp.]|uniref:hypothetical protein n=1 Tax=Sphingomonas sp. TaxID=28214 RepID=UPI0031D4583E